MITIPYSLQNNNYATTIPYILLASLIIQWLSHHILSYQLSLKNYSHTTSSAIYKIIIKWLRSNYDYKMITILCPLLSTLIEKKQFHTISSSPHNNCKMIAISYMLQNNNKMITMQYPLLYRIIIKSLLFHILNSTE